MRAETAVYVIIACPGTGTPNTVAGLKTLFQQIGLSILSARSGVIRDRRSASEVIHPSAGITFASTRRPQTGCVVANGCVSRLRSTGTAVRSGAPSARRVRPAPEGRATNHAALPRINRVAASPAPNRNPAGARVRCHKLPKALHRGKVPTR